MRRQLGVRAAVEALLRANEGASGFLSHPAPGLTVDQPPVAEQPGTVIGPYKLLQQIGEGGMGVVFMAEQTEPVKRKVALKIIKPGMDIEADHRPLRSGAAGPGDDGSRQHRQGLRWWGHGIQPAVLRHGAGPRCPHHQVLRRQPPDTARAAGVVRAGLSGDPARAPEGHHPPRRQTVERHDRAPRRQAGPEGDRLRRRQGDRAAADRANPVHALRHHGRHAGIHEPGAGGDERPGRRYPQRHLLPGRAPVRAA